MTLLLTVVGSVVLLAGFMALLYGAVWGICKATKSIMNGGDRYDRS
jgi:hypothetical protein